MSFSEWVQRWMDEAAYEGADVPDVEGRSARLAALWDEPIPGDWERAEVDAHVSRPERRDQRRRKVMPSHEHAIESAVLDDPRHRETTCLGGLLVDGFNAMPLTTEAAGAEADLLLLVEHADGHRILLVEVKEETGHAWFAAVENLLQVKLYGASEVPRQVFEKRGARLPEDVPVTGVVLAPTAFYRAPGRRERSVAPTLELLARMRAACGVDVVLATWDTKTRAIEEYVPAVAEE